MTTIAHEMESISSIGKDDDPDFVPELLSKARRTGSVLQAVRSLAVNKATTPIADPQVGRDCKLILIPLLASDLHAHMSPK